MAIASRRPRGRDSLGRPPLEQVGAVPESPLQDPGPAVGVAVRGDLDVHVVDGRPGVHGSFPPVQSRRRFRRPIGEATRAAVAAFTAEHQRVHDRERAVRLEGVDAVRARLEELQQSTEFECLSLNSGGAHRPDARKAATPLNQQALERGVMIRSVCRESYRNDVDTLTYSRWLTDLGGQIRTVPSVPIPLVIVDRRIAILALDPADPARGALEVHSPGMLAVAHALFEQIWSTGTPIGEAVRLNEHGCTPTEQGLLDFLSAGHTDEAAARTLGVSLRTVRRMMADLMERLDASSRFQAGINATTRGWL